MKKTKTKSLLDDEDARHLPLPGTTLHGSTSVEGLLQKIKGLENMNHIMQQENSHLYEALNQMKLEKAAEQQHQPQPNEKHKKDEAGDEIMVHAEQVTSLIKKIQELEHENTKLLVTPPPPPITSPRSSSIYFSHRLEELLHQVKTLTSTNRALQDGNSQLQEQVQELSQRVDKQQAMIANLLRQQLEYSNSYECSTSMVGRYSESVPKAQQENDDPTNHPIRLQLECMEMEQTIEKMQQRINSLVDEKLQLQTMLDSLEHYHHQLQQHAQENGVGVFKTKKGPRKKEARKSF